MRLINLAPVASLAIFAFAALADRPGSAHSTAHSTPAPVKVAPASIGKFSVVRLLDKMAAVEFNGEIEQGDAKDLSRFASKLHREGLSVDVLRLNSPGGNVEGALDLVEVVKRLKLATLVGAGDECASACFFIFLAGDGRWADRQALIGVHAVVNADSGRLDDDAKATSSTSLNSP